MGISSQEVRFRNKKIINEVKKVLYKMALVSGVLEHICLQPLNLRSKYEI